MKRWNIKTFYGAYGKIEEIGGKYNLEIIWNCYLPTEPYRKTYKTLKGAKIALGRLCDSYTISEWKNAK